MKLIEAHDKFMLVKKIEGLSTRTIGDYEKHFRYLINFIGKEIMLEEFNVDKVREYISYMVYTKELSNYTVNIRIRNIKSFFRFCYLEELIEKDLNRRIKLLKTDIDHIQPLTPEEFNQVVALVKKNKERFIRDRSILTLYLLLDCMLRISELVNIKVDHINLAEGLITLPARNTKSRKKRMVPFSDQSGKLIKKFLKSRPYQDSEYLFTNRYGKPLTADNVRYNFHHWSKQLDFKGKRFSPHVLRHSGALYYLLMGGDTFTLQKILGHSSLEVVRIYVQLADHHVKEHHNKFSPLKNLSKDKGS
ncbi:tyrosine-type recombinase/integrase [Bacillus mesophilum]|uniref:Tyrosine-type recombinase/integrase n=1 Tax=Bacillus mesophilum TaxID=1071718 RepID=A0A7V7RM66_9BACI|nr:tyrosine-type recombinase/integrase [Bacillus mesophilum]KAB2332919.1 tyrosine-type recombinase/integrase [Bacillus mesophilum]